METLDRQFCKPVAMPLDRQLDIMDDFWQSLNGCSLPNLDSHAYNNLEKILDTHPTWRVIPTPFLGLEELTQITNRALGYEPEDKALLVPDRPAIYRRIENRTGRPDTWEYATQEKYGVRYKIEKPTGKKYVDYEEYVRHLRGRNHALYNREDGKTWVFNITDPRVGIMQQNLHGEARKLYEAVGITSSKEFLVLLRILNHLTGKASNSVDVANEALDRINPINDAGIIHENIITIGQEPELGKIALRLTEPSATETNGNSLGNHMVISGLATYYGHN